jgi:NAD+ kinase
MRAALLVVHCGRADIRELARGVIRRLNQAGIEVRIRAAEAAALIHDIDGADLGNVTIIDGPDGAKGTEVALVVGGDGTVLRAAEDARPAGVPLLGVNLGHVGFLAESEVDALDATVNAIVDGAYEVEQRFTLRVTATSGGEVIADDWAMNEVSVEKTSREKLLEVGVSVDERPLLRFGCDGIICATPTGSTAYAFSAGGPVIWPQVDALLVVPLSAHALFARPLVLGPEVMVAFEVLGKEKGMLSCDGRRSIEALPGARVEVTRGTRPVRLARVHPSPFTDRLVAKFELPVEGWRGRPRSGRPSS